MQTSTKASPSAVGGSTAASDAKPSTTVTDASATAAAAATKTTDKLTTTTTQKATKAQVSTSATLPSSTVKSVVKEQATKPTTQLGSTESSSTETDKNERSSLDSTTKSSKVVTDKSQDDETVAPFVDTYDEEDTTFKPTSDRQPVTAAIDDEASAAAAVESDKEEADVQSKQPMSQTTKSTMTGQKSSTTTAQPEATTRTKSVVSSKTTTQAARPTTASSAKTTTQTTTTAPSNQVTTTKAKVKHTDDSGDLFETGSRDKATTKAPSTETDATTEAAAPDASTTASKKKGRSMEMLPPPRTNKKRQKTKERKTSDMQASSTTLSSSDDMSTRADERTTATAIDQDTRPAEVRYQKQTQQPEKQTEKEQQISTLANVDDMQTSTRALALEETSSFNSLGKSSLPSSTDGLRLTDEEVIINIGGRGKTESGVREITTVISSSVITQTGISQNGSGVLTENNEVVEIGGNRVPNKSGGSSVIISKKPLDQASTTSHSIISSSDKTNENKFSTSEAMSMTSSYSTEVPMKVSDHVTQVPGNFQQEIERTSMFRKLPETIEDEVTPIIEAVATSSSILGFTTEKSVTEQDMTTKGDIEVEGQTSKASSIPMVGSSTLGKSESSKNQNATITQVELSTTGGKMTTSDTDYPTTPATREEITVDKKNKDSTLNSGANTSFAPTNAPKQSSTEATKQKDTKETREPRSTTLAPKLNEMADTSSVKMVSTEKDAPTTEQSKLNDKEKTESTVTQGKSISVSDPTTPDAIDIEAAPIIYGKDVNESSETSTVGAVLDATTTKVTVPNKYDEISATPAPAKKNEISTHEFTDSSRSGYTSTVTSDKKLVTKTPEDTPTDEPTEKAPPLVKIEKTEETRTSTSIQTTKSVELITKTPKTESTITTSLRTEYKTTATTERPVERVEIETKPSTIKDQETSKISTTSTTTTKAPVPVIKKIYEGKPTKKVEEVPSTTTSTTSKPTTTTVPVPDVLRNKRPEKVTETTVSPSTTVKSHPKSWGPTWVLDPSPKQLCNKECHPYVAITKYMCAVGYENNIKRVNSNMCRFSGISCNGSTYTCTKQECGAWKSKNVLTSCNATCGFGFRKEEFNCQRNGSVLSDSLCLSSDKPKPYQSCIMKPCGNVSWIYTKWTRCIGYTCFGMKFRKAACLDSVGNIIPSPMCKSLPMPKTKESCEKRDCGKNFFWYKGEWSNCSAECGSGYQTRHVACLRQLRRNKIVIGSYCDYRIKPDEKRICQAKKEPCPRWMTSTRWKTPRVKYNNCTETRRVVCVNGTRIVSPKLCTDWKKPESSRRCKVQIKSSSKFRDETESDSYEDAEPNIRLSDEEVLRTDMYWTCPPIRESRLHKNYVWIQVNGRTRITLRNIMKRDFEVKEHQHNRIVVRFRAGTTVSKQRAGHYMCLGYNDTQNMWDGKYFHRTIGYYRTRLIQMRSRSKVDIVKAGSIMRLNCPLSVSQDTPIVWLRNNIRVRNVTGKEYKEFIRSDGTADYQCEDPKTKQRLKLTINAIPMSESECTQQPFGCCAHGRYAAVTQLHTECPGKSVIPCINSIFGCCPKQNVSAIGRHHLACKYRYLHPSRCAGDSQSLLKIMRKCSEAYPIDGIGQLRYHLDVTIKRCVPFTVNVACPLIQTIPLFATAENCRSHCVNVNSTERCKIYHVSVTDDDKCPSGGHVWYYDVWEQKCESKKKITDCLLNANRFISQTACNRECKYARYTRKDAKDECFQPLARGTCKSNYGYATNFFYDYSVGQCKQFRYTGCHGTTNRFTTISACNETCSGKVTPKVLKKICALPRDLGYCPLSPIHVRRWYYDPKDNLCKDMMYTQCGGNANNFESRRVCAATCGADTTVDICTLSPNKGDCHSKRGFRRYYYDWSSRSCRSFNYSGCGGNPNNFVNLRECNKECLDRTTVAPTQPPVPPRQPTDENGPLDYEPCQMAQSSGYCPSSIKTRSKVGMSRWYFDIRDGNCQQFEYMGCQGNANLFDTRLQCRRKCDHRLQKIDRECRRPVPNACYSESADGERITVYVYDIPRTQCLSKRVLPACKAFFFGTQEDCQSTCKHPIATDEHVTDKCYVTPQQYEQCPDYQKIQRWFYNVESSSCVQYTTCPFTRYKENSFADENSCKRSCNIMYIKDICVQPKDVGGCKRDVKRFYYNYQTRKCEAFWYTGCLGNKNRFISLKECRQVCEKEMETVAPIEKVFEPIEDVIANRPEYEFYKKMEVDICNIPLTKKHYGTCNNDMRSLQRWYYKDGKCYGFHYYGCGSMRNYFDSRHICEDQCIIKRKFNKKTNALGLMNVCHLPPFAGTCNRKSNRWYSDSLTGECREFIGCAGIPNSFDSKESCERACYAKEKIDICRLPKEPGPCKNQMLQWYYNNEEQKCRKFVYSGCHGNANRFLTLDECESICYKADRCRLKIDRGDDSGADTEWKQMFAFNKTSKTCELLWFTGKGGNANRFSTKDECDRMCSKVEVEPPSRYNLAQTFTCEQDKWIDAPCINGVAESRTFAYYDSKQKKCQLQESKVCGEAIIMGNRFTSLEKCQWNCEFKDEDENYQLKCKSPKPPDKLCSGKWKSKFYFDVERNICDSIWYGNCEAGKYPNLFETKEYCEATCFEPVVTTLEPLLDIQFHVADEKTAKNKSGECPPIPDTILNNENFCQLDCGTDADCYGKSRCCYQDMDPTKNKCSQLSVCMTPIFKTPTNISYVYELPDFNCHELQYGCCPDGVTIAIDKYYTNCPHEAPRTLSSGTTHLRAIAKSDLLTIKCNITAAPKAEIDWYHNNEKIPFGAGVHVSRIIKDDYLLKISPVRSEDSGNWTCHAKNKLGETSMTTMITVLIPAELTGVTRKVSYVVENKPYTLKCLSIGNPKPRYFWFFKPMALNVFRILPLPPSAMTYTIPKVNESTIGDYKCLVDNGVPLKKYIFNQYVMTVAIWKPLKAVVVTYPRNRKVEVGAQIRLSCTITSAAVGTQIFWSRSNLNAHAKETTQRDSTTLVIPQARFEDSGLYICHLHERRGTKKSFQVYVDVFRLSYELPESCQDEVMNCDVRIKDLRLKGAKECNKNDRTKCCRTCYESGLSSKDELLPTLP